MFAAFFYLLRNRGLEISLNEWITLLEGMEKGLHRSTLTGFYHLCRAVVVKSEAEYDRFDQVFLEFFQGVPWKGDLPNELLDWLNHPAENLRADIEALRGRGFPDETLEELLKLLEKRLQEQTEEHNGGSYWVGTQGRSAFGNSGWHPGGIRIGGQGRHRTAMMVAGERRFRDFRKDNTLDTRQFQTAFRLLRQLSARLRSRSGFPHEIGVFLGYPLEDVVGFMENKGKNYTCSGCWKSYGNPEEAACRFSRYHACTADYLRRFAGGEGVKQLTTA